MVVSSFAFSHHGVTESRIKPRTFQEPAGDSFAQQLGFSVRGSVVENLEQDSTEQIPKFSKLRFSELHCLKNLV
jgi:hypothetical protein